MKLLYGQLCLEPAVINRDTVYNAVSAQQEHISRNWDYIIISNYHSILMCYQYHFNGPFN